MSRLFAYDWDTESIGAEYNSENSEVLSDSSEVLAENSEVHAKYLKFDPSIKFEDSSVKVNQFDLFARVINSRIYNRNFKAYFDIINTLVLPSDSELKSTYLGLLGNTFFKEVVNTLGLIRLPKFGITLSGFIKSLEGVESGESQYSVFSIDGTQVSINNPKAIGWIYKSNNSISGYRVLFKRVLTASGSSACIVLDNELNYTEVIDSNGNQILFRGGVEFLVKTEEGAGFLTFSSITNASKDLNHKYNNDIIKEYTPLKDYYPDTLDFFIPSLGDLLEVSNIFNLQELFEISEFESCTIYKDSEGKLSTTYISIDEQGRSQSEIHPADYIKSRNFIFIADL